MSTGFSKATFESACSMCGKVMIFKDGDCAASSCVECREPMRLRFWELFEECVAQNRLVGEANRARHQAIADRERGRTT